MTRGKKRKSDQLRPVSPSWDFNMRKKVYLTLTVVVTTILFIPFPSTVVPSRSFRLLDQGGHPIANTNVELTCYHYTYSNSNLCSELFDSKQKTDDSGFVRFSERKLWLSLSSRIVRGIFHYALLPFHGSIGIRSTLHVYSPFELEPSMIRLDADSPTDNVIVLEKKD